MIGKILDFNHNIVFQWDDQKKTFSFNHKTLEVQALRGIEIPKNLQSEYGGHSIVYPPKDVKLSPTEYDLFIKAFTKYFFEKELAKNGFRKEIENPSFSKKA